MKFWILSKNKKIKFYKFFIYNLIIKKSVNEEWSLRFCKKKGFNHLLRIYEQITLEKIQNSFNLKCFGLLAKILTIFLTKFPIISYINIIISIFSLKGFQSSFKR